MTLHFGTLALWIRQNWRIEKKRESAKVPKCHTKKINDMGDDCFSKRYESRNERQKGVILRELRKNISKICFIAYM